MFAAPLVAGHFQQLLLKCREIVQQPAQLGAAEAAYLHRFQRLGAECVAGGNRQAQEIPHPGKSGHLPPPIGQQLVQLRRTGSDIEEVLGRVAFLDEGMAGQDGDYHRCRRKLVQVGFVDHMAHAQRTRAAGQADIRVAMAVDDKGPSPGHGGHGRSRRRACRQPYGSRPYRIPGTMVSLFVAMHDCGP